MMKHEARLPIKHFDVEVQRRQTHENQPFVALSKFPVWMKVYSENRFGRREPVELIKLFWSHKCVKTIQVLKVPR